ncbi:glycoside hydrolase family 3 N-terminal domain-containing protein [Streptomyces sp. YIM 98790]|uniref:beta-xylosidase/alpha-l-arabinosidase n=1 Tax=Streptomyces sp. YIM 98790 TaxID=2689077 RepID=UPI00140D712F|nr:glycoside hydrolase family 3 N-terminal domain-containing protein [Streptomyces sp. YIM 98790]
MPQPWQDAALPAETRAAELLSRMTLEEKTAQLSAIWPGSDEGGEDVAPLQHEFSAPPSLTVDSGEEAKVATPAGEAVLPAHGPGQLTRPFGTKPVDPAGAARVLARLQRHIAGANRFGIPAQVHEECLTGFNAWQAAILPTPLAWGASFDPALLERAAALIGASLRSVGVHQGLAPVLDVIRDPRWGRTEEAIAEDPYLVATIGTAYVRGLESAGVVATLKHFVGYSASHAARNHAPVSMGPREQADIMLPPFEMALRDGGARAVMHAYNDNDGMPAAADPELLTGLLRDAWGFEGVLVADYFGISFLELNHGVADSPAGAAALALAAGVDVELPAVRCYGEPLLKAVRSGEVPEELIDRAVKRVLVQKIQLGLLDEHWSPEPPLLAAADDPESVTIDLDPPELRAVARRLAEESVVLLANEGRVLPLAADARIAVTGPLADDPAAMLGCYTFPRHVLVDHPDTEIGLAVPTVLEALRPELPGATVTHLPEGPDGLSASERPDVWIAVLGDHSGLFGRGTSGEGCDAPDLELPGGQAASLDRLVETGIPVVLVLLSGRPYALGRWAGRLAAVVQGFFPGEEGGPAVAGVLSGRVNPSGRLPVSVPHRPGGQPWTYLAPPLGQANGATSLDPTPLYPFGHGLSYTSFAWEDPSVEEATVPTDGSTVVSVTVRNTGDREGTEVVQLYLHDPLARIVRPVNRLVGYSRVTLAAGESATVRFVFHADLAAYTLQPGQRIVEPGVLELRLGASSGDIRHTLPVALTGPERTVGHDRVMACPASTVPAQAGGAPL